LRCPASVRRAFRLARRLHRRQEFFKVLRAVELLGYYARYLSLFRSGRFRLAVMSSHSNPHGIAFNLAARRCGVPVVLVTHGMPVRPVAPLAYELAVVHCEAARQTYEEEGCRIGRVLVHGRREHYAPMPHGPLPGRLSVGVFLCKDVNEGRLRSLVEGLLNDSRVSCVLVRPHPKNLWRGLEEWVGSRGEPRLSLSGSGSVFEDVAASDVVLAGNSSVLAEALTAGRPAAYVRGIDHGSYDLHAFVSRGLVYEYEDERGLDTEAMRRFYQRADWPDALQLFSNVREDAESVAARTRDELLALTSLG
ncbi:MAG TPA: glycosyltransferase, partial [Pyrinomonadaceae bacterium]